MLTRNVFSMGLWVESPRWQPSGANDSNKAGDRTCSKGIANSCSGGSTTTVFSSNENIRVEQCSPLCLETDATSANPAPAATAVPPGRRGATPAVSRTRVAAVRRSSPLRAPVSCHPAYSNCGCFFSAIAACSARPAGATAGAAAATSGEKPTPQLAQPASPLAARSATRAGRTPVEIEPSAPDSNSSSGCYCYRCSNGGRKPSTALLLPYSSRRSLLTCSNPPAVAASPIAADVAASSQQNMSSLTQQQSEVQQQRPPEPAPQRQAQNEHEEGWRYQQQQEQEQQEAEDPLLLRAMRTHAFLHLVSGAVAGAVSRTATAPLDRLKVMLQLQPSPIPLRHAARVIMHQEVTAKTAAAGAAAEAAALVRGSSSTSPGAKDSQPALSQRQLPQQPQQPHQQQQQHTGRAAGMQPTGGSTSHVKGSSGKSRLLFCGWQGFFRGNLTNCLKVVPETAIKFYTYDLCKHALARRKQQQLLQQQPQQLQSQQLQTQHQLLLQQEPHLQMRERFVCGAAAGLCAQLLIYPMELVKTRLAAYSPGCMYSGVLQCFKAIYREGGIRRLYRGLAPSLLGVIPYAGIDLAVFESLKEAYIQRIAPRRLRQQQEACSSCNPPFAAPWKQTAPSDAASAVSDAANAAAVEQAQLGSLGASATPGVMGVSGASRCRCCCDAGSASGPVTPPAIALLLMGGCSSLIGQVVAYPTALIRTRMQVDGSGGKQLQYRSSAAAAAVALKQGGLRGLYRGLGANCCKALPAVSLSWIAYEKTKEAIRWVEGLWSERIAQARDINAAPMLQQRQGFDAIPNVRV
ncbi:hypothetical protein Emed_000879 [Eimeria media]